MNWPGRMEADEALVLLGQSVGGVPPAGCLSTDFDGVTRQAGEGGANLDVGGTYLSESSLKNRLQQVETSLSTAHPVHCS